MNPCTIRLPLAALLATLLPACAGGDPTPPASASTDPARHQYGSVAFEPCTLTAGAANVAARCGHLEVPEDRNAPQGRTLKLRLAWVPADDLDMAAEDPVFFLAGGPGQSALDVWPQVDPAFAEVGRQRHVVLVDQRGTGGSNPLDCELPDDAAQDDEAAIAGLVSACVQALAERADTRFYTTTDAVADLDAVRQAIGAEQVNLVGVSYGTRVAQQYARQHPQHVRSLVLDGVVPNDLVVGGEFADTFEDALKLQSARCHELPTCAQRFPRDARAQLAALMARLDAAPVQVEYRDPATAQVRQGTVDDQTVVGLAFLFSYMPQTASLLPLVLDEAAAGRMAPLLSLQELMKRGAIGGISRGMQWSVICAEDADRYLPGDSGRDTLLGPDVARMFFAACPHWPHGTRPADFTAPLESGVPALLLSGELDPVTPPRYAEQVLKGLSAGRHIVLRGQGHGQLVQGCMPRVLGQFLESADAASLDAACLDTFSYIPPFTSFNGWEP